jgi:adenine-specific DNA methylase
MKFAGVVGISLKAKSEKRKAETRNWKKERRKKKAESRKQKDEMTYMVSRDVELHYAMYAFTLPYFRKYNSVSNYFAAKNKFAILRIKSAC